MADSWPGLKTYCADWKPRLEVNITPAASASHRRQVDQEARRSVHVQVALDHRCRVSIIRQALHSLQELLDPREAQSRRFLSSGDLKDLNRDVEVFDLRIVDGFPDIIPEVRQCFIPEGHLAKMVREVGQLLADQPMDEQSLHLYDDFRAISRR